MYRLPRPPLLPTPSAVALWAFPGGIPALREPLLARTGLTGESTLDPDASPGDPGLFGPGSATWEIAGQASSALAGLRAALLQALSAPVPTATHSTGRFYSDFMGRVSRTGAYVQAQNLGSMDEVHRSARRVRAMHSTVKGSSDGLDFDAGDLDQQAWVSMTLTDSFLVVTDRFGTGPLRRSRADRFVAEQARHAALLDPRVDLDAVFGDPDQRAALQAGELPLPQIDEGRLPTTVADLRAAMKAFTPELFVTDLTRELIDGTVTLAHLPEPQRRIGRLFVLAVLSTVPDDLHALLAPNERRLDELIAAEAVQGPIGALQAVLGRSRSVAIAHRRARRRASA